MIGGRIGVRGQKVVWLNISARPPVEVDAEIAPLVMALNEGGLPTRASCSGHGVGPGSVILWDEFKIYRATPEQAAKIDALFPIDINGGTRG